MRQKSRVPELRIHKATGQAYVLVEGRRLYLGRHDKRETQERYRRTVAELLANGGRLPPPRARRDRGRFQ